MNYRRWLSGTILIMVLSVLLVACAQQVTPEATEEPTATEEVAEATEQAVEPTEAEETEAVAEATEVEATEEATEAEETEAVAEATEAEETEAVAEATEAEATEEATEAEPTEAEETEAVAEATEAEETEAPTGETVSADELGLPYSFDYTSDFTATAGINNDTATLTKGDQKINIVGPTAYLTVLSTRDFESDADQLSFFLDRTGYDVGDAVETTEGLASFNVAIPRAHEVGVATLVDLENGRRGVVIALGPDADNVPTEAAAAIANSLVYPPDLADVAASTDGFSTLLAALEAAGIDLRAGEYTVFAPTDEAFTAALDSLGMTQEELLADTESLTSILNYHLVEGTLLAADLTAMDGETLTTVNGATLTVGVSDDGGVTLTDANGNVANVVTADVTASNGVLHVIDAVLMPPAPEAESTEEATTEAEATAEATEEAESTEEASVPTIVGVAIGNSDLSTLATAVVRAGLTGDLNGEGPFTVFAPTNEAFAAALDSLSMTADELLGNREQLRSILNYHVVEGTLRAADLTDGQELTTLNGATLTVHVTDDGVTLTDAAGNTVNVVTADFEASNGVVHVIDGVLMPEGE